MQPLEQVARRLKGLIIKRPGMVFGLWGEAGIGKTHCATQLLRESQCKNISLHATIALSNLARALPKPKTLPIWTTRILEKLELGEALSTEQTTSTFGAVLSGIAPFVLHLEDVHEASPERLEWIVAMAKVVTRLKGVALVVTSRTQPPEPFESIRLEKLDFEAVKTLLETEARSILPLEALEWIHGKAAGNPLFTLEFFRFLARLGFVWNDGKKWRWRKPEQELLPVTVEALLEQTLLEAANTTEFQAVLSAKAMLGLNDSDVFCADVTGLKLDVVQKALLVLEDRGIFFKGHFAHPLYQEVALRRLSRSQRRALAVRAIERLEVSSPETALFWLEEAELDNERSFQLLRMASQCAQQRGDLAEAARLVVRSVSFAPESIRPRLAFETLSTVVQVDAVLQEQLCRWAIESEPYRQKATYSLARLWVAQGKLGEAEALMETLPEAQNANMDWLAQRFQLKARAYKHQQALEWLHQHPEVQEVKDIPIQTSLVLVFSATGLMKQAQEILANLLVRSDLSDNEINHVHNIAAVLAFRKGDAQAMFDHAQIALEADERIGDIRGLSEDFHNKALALRSLGRFLESRQAFEQAWKKALELNEMVSYWGAQVNYAGSLLESGDYEHAHELLLEAREHLIRLGNTRSVFICLMVLGQVYQNWQPPHIAPLALKYAHQALKLARDSQNENHLVAALELVASTELWTGHLENASSFAQEAVDVSKRVGMPVREIPAKIAYANVLSASQRPLEALSILEEVFELSREHGLSTEEQMIGLEIDHLKNDFESAKQRHQWCLERGFILGADIARKLFPAIISDSTANSTTQSQVALQLNLLGDTQIIRSDQPESIRGRKRQELLVLLLEARVTGKSELTRLEFFDALYPNEPEDRAASSLKELIRDTRANLGADAIQTTQNGYALGQVTTDVEEFFKTGNSSLWRGGYLQNLEILGSETVRESLELALQTCTEKLLETDAKEAARVSRFLLEMNLYDLEHLRLLLRAFKASENYKTLGRVYNEARDRFADLGEMLPERWQNFLELSIPA